MDASRTPKASRGATKSRAPTFRELASEINDFHRPMWRNPRSLLNGHATGLCIPTSR